MQQRKLDSVTSSRSAGSGRPGPRGVMPPLLLSLGGRKRREEVGAKKGRRRNCSLEDVHGVGEGHRSFRIGVAASWAGRGDCWRQEEEEEMRRRGGRG